MKDPVTMASMVIFSSDNTLELPKSFVTTLKESEGQEYPYLIMILNNSSQVIRIAPTNGEQVVKLTIYISELAPSFLQRLGDVLTKSKVKTLYSTGVCFTEKTCSYEGYIDLTEFVETSPENLKTALSQIPGISKVEMEILSP